MIPAGLSWAEREQRLRHYCYWAWLLPPVGSVVLGTLAVTTGAQALLALAPLPFWALLAMHLAYFAAMASRRSARLAMIAVWLAIGGGATAGMAAGAMAGVSTALALPLAWCAAVAQAPPVGGSLRRLAMVTTMARPFALAALGVCAWILGATVGGRGLPPGHAVAWWTGAGLALAIALTPSAIFHVMLHRTRPAPPAQP